MIYGVLNSIPLAIGIAVSPMAIVAVVVLLAQGNRRGARWFLVGWIAGLTVLTGIVAIFGQNMQQEQHDAVRPWVPTVEIFVGVAIILWVIFSFVRNRNAPPQQEMPKVLQAVDKIGPAQSFGMATFMAVVNLKNVAMLLAFLLVLLARPRPLAWTLASLATFILVASVTIAIPVIYALIKGKDAEPMLEKMRKWLVEHQSAIMNGFLGIIGLVLLLQGLAA